MKVPPKIIPEIFNVFIEVFDKEIQQTVKIENALAANDPKIDKWNLICQRLNNPLYIKSLEKIRFEHVVLSN